MLEIPPWKAEFLERKKAAKIKAEQVPEWKRELLKRLQNKAEAAKHRMEDDGTQNGQAVLNEHVVKVSDNIFVKQERHRKMSSGSQMPLKSPSSPTKDFPPHGGFHVIKTENIVIIEKGEEQTNEKQKEVDKEMPESGIVNRLKDKFADGKSQTPTYQRAQSSDNFYDTETQDVKPAEQTEPTTYQRTYSAPTKPSTTTHPPKLVDTSKSKSLDFYTPRSFSQSHGIHKVTSPTRKVTAPPVLQAKNDAAKNFKNDATKNVEQKTVDIATLHSSGSPKHSSPTKVVSKSSKTQNQVVNVGYSVDLHSGGQEKSSALPVSNVDNIETTKPQHKAPNEALQPVKAFPAVESFVIEAPKLAEPVKPLNKVPSLDKENIPQNDEPPVAPPRAKTASRTGGVNQRQAKPKPASVVKNAEKPNVDDKKNNFKIVDLGRTSLDPSLLKTPGAIYANEIMKESRTLRIIPKSKSQNNDVSMAVTPKPSKNLSAQNKTLPKTEQPSSLVVDKTVTSQTKTPLIAETNRDVKKVEPQTVENNKKPSVVANHSFDKEIKDTKPLPVSSVDDVITKEAVPKNNVVRSNFTPAQNVNTAKTTVAEVKQKQTEVKVVNNSSTDTSTPSVKDMFGPRKGGSGPRGGAFGGKSFVFDPSKFKRSAAPPITTGTNKKFDASGLPKTMVIKPSQNSAARASETSEDGKGQGKGKRKLTVDQIQVIGGYVKLDHCTLSKKRHKNVSHHVSFKLEHLESVFQYPSERSLLLEDHQISMEQKSTLNKLPGSGKDSSLGKYTPKYLLSMKEKLNVDDDDDVTSKPDSSEDTTSKDAIPDDGDASAFGSKEFPDILF